jgi:rRNA maturation RNase YbeY
MEEMKTAIHFFSENIPFVLKGKGRVRAWLRDCIAHENKAAGILNFIFCDDEYMLPINRSYLHHDTLTDTITFDYSDLDNKVQGDVYISIERARENAEQFNVSPVHEIHRLIIHGVLHLCGYEDKNPEGKRLMSEKEDYYLSLLPE